MDDPFSLETRLLGLAFFSLICDFTCSATFLKTLDPLLLMILVKLSLLYLRPSFGDCFTAEPIRSGELALDLSPIDDLMFKIPSNAAIADPVAMLRAFETRLPFDPDSFLLNVISFSSTMISYFFGG